MEIKGRNNKTEKECKIENGLAEGNKYAGALNEILKPKFISRYI